MKTCKYCGKTLKDFSESGLLGCEHCYETFSEELSVILSKLHGVTEHKGKAPDISDDDRKLIIVYENLLKEKTKQKKGSEEEKETDIKLISVLKKLRQKGLR